ncbi:MAG TPA: protein kinase [Kofleriaceae bacterium]|nr:protein kinase [Kofleriaceae bacterium]
MSGIPAGAGSLLGKRLGKYEILALLALGGTAEIYLARIGGAAGFEKYVVVKCLHDHLADDAEFVKMFLDEARLAAHLDHSNIVQTMELGEHEHRYFMVMEFLAGLSLAMMVRRASERLPGGRIPVPLVMNIIAQACAGLHYAHERVVNGKPLNIVHRDISPQNLVVSFEGVVKVVDFGIAKAELRETRTQSGTIKGKFAYMSPEQCIATNVDRRTDVFALGVIAHELVTGRRLFKKPSPYETYQAVIECAVEPPSRIDPSIDPAIDPIIMRAVAKEKERRYATAEELGDSILRYLHQRGISSGPADVSRFFDSVFGQEIEEHGARMRELISGRVADPGATWGEGDDDAKQAVDVSGQIGGDQPGPESSLSSVLGDLGGGGDDNMPADRTRIETNPLERLDEMNAEAARQPSRQQPAVRPPSGPQPVARQPSGAQPVARQPSGAQPAVPPAGRPTGGSQMPSIPSGPLTTPPPGRMSAISSPVVRGPKSGKFSDAAANLPTMIAQPDGGGAEQPDLDSPDMVQTELIPNSGSPLDPLAGLGPSRPAAPPPGQQSDPNAHTMLEMAAPNMDQVRASMGLPPRSDQGPGPGQPPPPSPSQQHPQIGPSGAQQMAMMDGQALPGMPGAPGAPGAQPNGSPPSSMQPPRSNMPPLGPSGYPVMDAQMRDQLASGATVFPSLGSGQHDSRAGDVGPGGPGATDWAGGPTAPTRVIPPWMLAVLFVGALGGALLITILIAQALR